MTNLFDLNLECICYDDACHLKKYAQNPKRHTSEVSKKLSNLTMSVDRFHFGNHKDRWCKTNCNPYGNVHLQNVSTYFFLHG